MELHPETFFDTRRKGRAGKRRIFGLCFAQERHDLRGTLRRPQPAWCPRHQALEAIRSEARAQSIERLPAEAKSLTYSAHWAGVDGVGPQHFVLQL